MGSSSKPPSGLSVENTNMLLNSMTMQHKAQMESMQQMHSDSMKAMKDAMEMMMHSNNSNQSKFEALAHNMGKGFGDYSAGYGQMFRSVTDMMSTSYLAGAGGGISYAALR